LKGYVTDMMQCNTITHGSKFTTENMQFSRLSPKEGLIKYHYGQLLAVTRTTVNASSSGRS